MKARSVVVPTIFLQAVLVLLGLGALAFMIWEPRVEGRNAHSTLFQTYFQDPFLAYAYVASVAFFVGLHRASQALGSIRRNQAFSPATIKAVRTIKTCALALIGFIAGGELFILLSPSDDRAGGVFMGLLFTFASGVVAAAAAVLERLLQNAVGMRPADDRTG